MSSEYIVGIDLGTTNSVVAILDGDVPRVLPNSEGGTKTPSVVSFLPNGEVVVGEVARRQGAILPRNTIDGIKRLMGRSPADIEALGLKIPYDLASTSDQQLIVRIGDSGYTPAQISAFILTKLKQAAEDFVGEAVTKAVITVPAYFDDLQRQATREAGKLAGLDVLRLVNEPTAAAMAYGLGKDEKERVAVYDFGGGTFDLTIIDISEGTYEVLTSQGDTHLGGDDLDYLLVQLLLERFRKVAGEEFEPDPMAQRRLKEAAEKAKCDLSQSKSALVNLPFLAQVNSTPYHLETSIAREDFEDIAEPIVNRTLNCCREALEDINLRVANIDKVVLVGGTTRIPMVQEMVEDFFDITPFKGVNPDEIVALGAATQAGVMAGKLKEVLLLDVTPHTLGVEVMDGRMARVIEKNQTIPFKASRLFTTTEDGQEIVSVHVLQGESEKVSENRPLGKFSLTGIQPAKAGNARLQVTFQINSDGMVEVSAEDMATHVQQSLTLTLGGEDTIQAARERNQGRSSPKRRRRSSGRTTTPVSNEVLTGIDPAGRVREKSSGSDIRPLPVANVLTPSDSDTAKRTMAAAQNMTPPPAPVSTGADTDARTSQPAPSAPVETAQNIPANAEKSGPPPFAEVPTYPITDTQKRPRMSDNATMALEYVAKHSSSASAYEIYLSAYTELKEYAQKHLNEISVVDGSIRILIMLGERDSARQLLKVYAETTGVDPRDVIVLRKEFASKFPGDSMFGATPPSLPSAADTRDHAGLSGGMDESIVRLEAAVADNMGSDAEVESLIQLYRRQLTNRDDSSTQFKLVQLLIRLDRLDEAINILQRLVHGETFRSHSLKILGMCFWKKGLHYLAWQKFQQLPPNDEVKDILSRLAGDMEDSDQLLNAKVVLQHLVNIEPEYRDVQQRLNRVEQMIRLEAGDRQGNMTPSIFLTLKDSRFVILEEVNRGSMGIVYRARDKVLEEIVALKILNDYMTTDPNAVERFKREARAAKRLSHPNIVRIHDMFEYGNKKLLSMEYIEGVDLKKVLQDRKFLPPWEIAGITRPVCEALAYAHGQSIVHRDIKPANIMITNTNLVKVTDFGIAKVLLAGPDSTRSGSQIIGTPLYMSPEQILGTEIDARTDIYSVGATMYEMATGRPPFLDGNIEYHHLHTAPPTLPENVGDELSYIILKCLAKAPDDRFQSTSAIAAALEKMARPQDMV